MQTLFIILGCICGLAVLVFFLYLLAMKPAARKHEVIERNKHYLFAHRGFYNEAEGVPENSKTAFKRAVERGYGFEFDVRMTKDKKVVVFHDSNTDRVCGPDLMVKDTNSTELEKLRLNATEETIPYFSELLEIVDGKVPLIIEVKSENGSYDTVDDTVTNVFKGNNGDYADLTKAVCDMLKDYKGDYMIESFDPFVVHWLKKHRPDICRGQLIAYFNRHGEPLSPLLDFIMYSLITTFITKPDFIAFDYQDRTQWQFRLCKKLYGVTEVSWTIHNQQEMDDCLTQGAIPIFENFVPTQSPEI